MPHPCSNLATERNGTEPSGRCNDETNKENAMNTRKLIPALLIAAASITATGCATWDNMSSREKSAATGAAVGGVAGAVVTDGGILGTVGGAAVGGLIGDQLGKDKDRRR